MSNGRDRSEGSIRLLSRRTGVEQHKARRDAAGTRESDRGLAPRSRCRRSRTGSSRPTRSAAAIHHLGHSPLPSYREVVEILADLREILYPGYGRRQNLHMGNVGYHVGDLIDSLHDRLTQQIARAFRHDCKARDLETDFEAEAQLIAIRLLDTIPELRTGPGRGRPGRLRRRPGRQEPRRDPLLLPRRGGDHRLPDRPRAAPAGRAADPPDDDRVRPRQDRHRHPPRRHDRPPVLHRPRHRRRHRRDDPDRRRREDLPGRDPRRPELPPRRVPARSSATPSGTRRSRTRSSSTPTPRSSAARPSSATTPSSAPRPGSPGASPPTRPSPSKTPASDTARRTTASPTPIMPAGSIIRSDPGAASVVRRPSSGSDRDEPLDPRRRSRRGHVLEQAADDHAGDEPGVAGVPPASRRGSRPRRKAHSRPVFCIQRGARRTRPAAKSSEAPTCDADRDPQRLEVSPTDPTLALGLAERHEEEVGARPRGCDRGARPPPRASARRNGGHSVPTIWRPG